MARVYFARRVVQGDVLEVYMESEDDLEAARVYVSWRGTIVPIPLRLWIEASFRLKQKLPLG